MQSWLYSHLAMGCGVSTFYCMDNGGLVKPQPPPEDPKAVVKDDAVSRQTMVTDETGESCSSIDSSRSSACQPRVACITIHVPKENAETEKARENGSSTKNEEKGRNEILGDTTTEDQRSTDGDSEGEDESWWRKGNTEFMRSPSFRDYCIIHYSSDDEEETEGNVKTSNDTNMCRMEKTKVFDTNKKGLKKSRGKFAKSRPKGKKVLRKEGSGSLRSILNVATCYSQSHSSKSPH